MTYRDSTKNTTQFNINLLTLMLMYAILRVTASRT